jgi:hypothetical protein
MEYGGATSCSQEANTGPYPELDESNQHPQNWFL